MAEKKAAGPTRNASKGGGRVSAKERARRQAQRQETTGTATLPTGEKLDDVRAALEEARAANEAGRTFGSAAAAGANPTSITELRERALGELMQMPSGLIARVRRPGMIALLQAGMIPNSLMPFVEKALEKGAQGQTVSQEELFPGEIKGDFIREMMDLYDKVTMFVVVEPALLPNPVGPGNEELPSQEWPTHDGDRELAYIGWVPFEDKEFIFNYAVGGTRDVQRFQDDLQANAVEPV